MDQFNTVRSSNIELLRCLLMYLIVVSHFVAHNILAKSNTDPLTAGDMNYFSSNILLALSIGAVNCFVIISGYFTIKLSLRKVVLFVLPIIFYEIVLGIAFHGLKPQGFSLLNYWFVKQYLALMLLSPVLNLGLNKLDKNKLRLLLIISFIIYVLPIQSVSGNRGMNLFIFIMMYMIGYYIRNYLNLRYKWGGVFCLLYLHGSINFLRDIAIPQTW